MNIDVTHPGAFTQFIIAGNLDSSNAREFELAMLAELSVENRYVLMDFNGCDFMSSAGIRVILICAKLLKARAGKLVITGLNEYVNKVFAVAGLHQILIIRATKEDGQRHLEEAMTVTG